MSTNATFKQAGHILTLIDQKGVTKDQLAGAVSDGTMPDFFEAMATGTVPNRVELRNFLGLTPLVFPIVVDYSMTLADMIAVGRYDWNNHYITAENFPLSGQGKVEIKLQLVHLNRHASSEDVEKELGKRGLRSATIEELLAFGATFPEIQRRFPIFALGSGARIEGGRCVASLGTRGSERRLFLDGDCDGFWETFWFLAVPK